VVKKESLVNSFSVPKASRSRIENDAKTIKMLNSTYDGIENEYYGDNNILRIPQMTTPGLYNSSSANQAAEESCSDASATSVKRVNEERSV
jgi:hypothetical protein